MSRIVLADAGPLYAALDPDDQFHAQARGELAVLNRLGIGVAVAYSTFAETYTLVSRRLGTRRALRFGQELTSGSELLHPSPDDYHLALSRLAKHADLLATMFDGVVVVLSERLRLRVWTYDDHLRVLGATVWDARDEPV